MKSECPIQFHGIDHVVLQVTEVEKTLHFYTTVLGLSVERVIEDMGLYQVRCGRNLIDLRVLPEGSALADKDQRGVDHVCLHMHGDFDAIVQYLKDNAVPITFGPVELYGATGYGTSVYITDPNGHTLELKADYSQYPLKTTVKGAMAGVSRPAAN